MMKPLAAFEHNGRVSANHCKDRGLTLRVAVSAIGWAHTSWARATSSSGCDGAAGPRNSGRRITAEKETQKSKTDAIKVRRIEDRILQRVFRKA
jgi:hypothetical protein